jgi:1-deoxy-D-xylulose-5-phosphate reductoisomerase
MKRISILGSTGSIGRSTLSVAESYPDRFQIVALAAGSNLEAAYEQARRWRPRMISIAAASDADVLRTRLKQAGLAEIEVVHGPAGNVKVATHGECDFVVSAIVGVAGLEATYEAVKAGKTIGVANKECLVAAGELITAEARAKASRSSRSIANTTRFINACARGGWMKSSASG